MGVRVELGIKSRFSHSEIRTSALVNSGYEVVEPEILLPRRAAEYLGIPLTPPHARILTYETPAGFYKLLFVQKAVDVHLVSVCVRVESVNVASKRAGYTAIDIARGVWRHERDPIDVTRPSPRPEYW